jgi:hypothetical protein
MELREVYREEPETPALGRCNQSKCLKEPSSKMFQSDNAKN